MVPPAQVLAADMEQRSQFTSGFQAMECTPQLLLGDSGRPLLPEFMTLHGRDESLRLWKESVVFGSLTTRARRRARDGQTAFVLTR